MKFNKKSKHMRKSRRKPTNKKSITKKYKKKFGKLCKGGAVSSSSPETVEEDCPICLEPMPINDNTTFTNLFNCRHIFHKVCIIQMIISARNARNDVFEIKCPMCRAALSRPQGTGTVETINGILDINNDEAVMNMFRDILQYNYVYHQSFFHLYIIPIARRIGSVMASDRTTVISAATFFCLSFVITGSDARQLLRSLYIDVLIFQFLRMIFNFSSMIRGENRLANAVSLGIFFISFSFNNLEERTDAYTVITPYGAFNINDAFRYISDLFGRFLVDESDFLQHFNELNDDNNREPYSRFGGSATTTKSIRFKFISMNDVKDFLNIVGKNKEKLETLLDKQPFTVSIFFPEIEYSRELVEKLRPLIKN